MSLADLSAARLLELGGLKERCSAGLRCVAHGLDLPCALCEVEDGPGRGAVCTACGHHFAQGVPQPTGRACESRAAFAAGGRIAFEGEALARQRELEDERRRKEQAESDVRGEAAAQRRREMAEARRAEVERAERAGRERLERERVEARRVPPARLKRDVAALAGALAVGVVVVGLASWKERIFGGGAEPLVAATVPQAPAAPPVAAPRPSATAQSPEAARPVATPVQTGFVTDVAGALEPDDAAYLGARLERLARSGFAARLLLLPGTGGEDIAVFGARVANAWNAAGAGARSELLVTVATRERRVRIDVAEAARDRVSDAAAKRLIDAHFSPAARSGGVPGGLRRLVDGLERHLAEQRQAAAGEAQRTSATLDAVQAIGHAVSTWDGRLATLALPAQARLESAVAELESMPRPARGDRKAARRLHANGVGLVGQAGFEMLAVQALEQAHAADPLDVQVLNDLAYAEIAAGRHEAALKHLLQTLRLAPKRTSAWVNLAELVPLLAAQPAPATAWATTAQATAQATAVAMYRVGYWFSGDRPKMLGYLRGRAAGEDTGEASRTAAAEALRQLETMAAASSATEATATAAPARAESPSNENATAVSALRPLP